MTGLNSTNFAWRKLKYLARLVVGLVVCLQSVVATADWDDDIGYTQLVSTLSQLNMPIPNGNGVPISLVEAGGPSHRSYWPNPDHSSGDFFAASDPLGMDVTFIDGSNVSNKVVSDHASSQARNFFGNNSAAPAANVVTVYEAGYFLQQQLGAPSGGSPQELLFRVQNHSWKGSLAQDENNPTPAEISQDVQTLRRYDFVINKDNITAIVGLDNTTTPLPRLLSHSYNVLAVGRTDGQHSTGLTSLVDYGPGRSKPDLVAPRTTTSAATSTTSGVATLLHSAVAGTNAAKSQVIKAMLMAGATKEEFPSWSRSVSQPLDDTFGAGEVNVFNSYLMTLGGRYAGSSVEPVTVGSHGWDFQSAVPGAGNERKYRFVVPQGSTAQDLSILLTWNVNVVSGFSGQSLANLNMTLTNSLGQTVDQSLSAVDNVEHIYLPALSAGDYTLSISTDTSRDYGLAWRMNTLFDVPSADFDEDGDVDGRDFLVWQRGYGKLIDALHADGDANGDGAVNQLDLSVLQNQYGPTIVSPPSLLVSVPEPTGAVLLAGGVLGFFIRRGRRRLRRR